MGDALATAVGGTAVLWLISATAACALALLLTAGSLSSSAARRRPARVVINVTRGVPTSILVVAAGILALRSPAAVPLPDVFPGTSAAFQHVAWILVAALAFGSAGHLAEIFRSAYEAVGRSRREELLVLGLPRWRHLTVGVAESALVALPATGTRLVHHLHNTAFAALFPVVELFGLVLVEAYTSFRVVQAALLGSSVYIALSGLIWTAFKVFELILRHGVAPVRARAKAVPA